MKKMRRLLLLGIFCLFFSTGFSQKYLPGYIITLENDTVYGEIFNHQDLNNLRKCTFKDKMGKIEKFQPNDIYGYRFENGRYYISKKVKSEELEEIVFLEYLVKGVVDLYYYPSIDGNKYFILKDNNFEELTNTKKSIKVNGSTYTKYDKKYIGLLKYLFKDAPEVVKNVDYTKFSPSSLIKITKNYHNSICPDENCIIFKGKDKKFRIGVKVLSEYTFSTLYLKRYYHISDATYSYASKSISNYSYSYGLGVFLISADKRFNLEYTISKNNSLFSGNTYSDDTPANRYFNEIKSGSIENRLIVNYSYTHYKLKPYLKIGIVYDFITDYEIVGGDDFNFPNVVYGLVGGIGLKYSINSNFELDLSSHYSSYNGDDNLCTSKYSDLNVLLGLNYFIKKHK